MERVAAEGAARNHVGRYRALREADRFRVELEALVPPESLIRLVDVQEVRRRHRAPRVRSRAIGELFWWSVLREPCPARPARPRTPEELPDFLVAMRWRFNWLLTRACHDVYEALYAGDAEAIDVFVVDLLGIPLATSEDRVRLWAAVWEVIASGRWASVTRRRLAYLRRGVRRAAGNLDEVRHDRSRKARRAARSLVLSEQPPVSGEEAGSDGGQEPARSAMMLSLEAAEDPNGGPEAWFAAVETIRDRLRRHPLQALGYGATLLPELRRVVDELHREGLPTDQKDMLDLVEGGLAPGEAVAVTRQGWVSYRALEAKMRRRLARGVK